MRGAARDRTDAAPSAPAGTIKCGQKNLRRGIYLRQNFGLWQRPVYKQHHTPFTKSSTKHGDYGNVPQQLFVAIQFVMVIVSP